MSDASQIRRPAPDRFEKLGYGPRHQRKPLTALDLRSQLMLEYMLVGCQHRDICDRIGVQVGEPMTQQQASDAVGFRRRNGRFVFQQAIFQKGLAKGIEELRSGARVQAIRRMIELMNDPGDGSAACKTVQLKAASAIMGDESKSAVTVNVGVSAQLSPGVVIRLPAEVKSPPLEQAQPPIIEHGGAMRTSPIDGQLRYLPDDEDANG
ncbi:hypothetical protein WOC76_04335 [Methylocystis sp. IM3]|uniref:hypothetical protein n=1 Tax=unclassified Methylocystis TaxID=2625913 RepID=UPI0030FAD276